MNRYDVVYSSKDSYPVVPYIEYHFCRCYPCDDSHGYTFEEGKQIILDWLENHREYLKNYMEEGEI